jgi:hypothetical protein
MLFESLHAPQFICGISQAGLGNFLTSKEVSYIERRTRIARQHCAAFFTGRNRKAYY